MDEDSHEVTRAGDEVHLTATEFELLRYLMRNPKRVLSKAQILDRVWNYDFGGQANVVELYISYLRKKIDAGQRPDDPHHAWRRLRAQARGLIRRVLRMPTSPSHWTLRAKLLASVARPCSPWSCSRRAPSRCS